MININWITILWTLGNLALWALIIVMIIKLIKRGK